MLNTYLKTGFQAFNDFFNSGQGVRPGDSILIQGPNHSGKSILATNLMRQLLQYNAPGERNRVLYFNREGRMESLLYSTGKHLSGMTGANLHLPEKAYLQGGVDFFKDCGYRTSTYNTHYLQDVINLTLNQEDDIPAIVVVDGFDTYFTSDRTVPDVINPAAVYDAFHKFQRECRDRGIILITTMGVSLRNRSKWSVGFCETGNPRVKADYTITTNIWRKSNTEGYLALMLRKGIQSDHEVGVAYQWEYWGLTDDLGGISKHITQGKFNRMVKHSDRWWVLLKEYLMDLIKQTEARYGTSKTNKRSS